MKDNGICGVFRFTADRDDHRVTVEVSGGADIHTMLTQFEGFLIAAGYDARLVRETLYCTGDGKGDNLEQIRKLASADEPLIYHR